MSIDLVLTVVAGVLGAITVVQSRGMSLVGWGVLLLAVVLLPLFA